MLPLPNHGRPTRLCPIPNNPLLIFPGAFSQQRVECLPTGHLRHRYQVIPAKVPHFSFDAPFLVTLPRRTELGLKTPMRSEGDESCGFLALMPSQDLFHCTAEVVIAHGFKYAPKISEPLLVPFQKCLLVRMGKGTMESSATGHAAHGNIWAFCLSSAMST